MAEIESQVLCAIQPKKQPSESMSISLTIEDRLLEGECGSYSHHLPLARFQYRRHSFEVLIYRSFAISRWIH